MRSKYFTGILCLLITTIACHQRETKEVKGDTAAFITNPERFIKPPLKNVDVPYKEFIVEAQRGDTLFYQSGSIIIFPSNAFIDKNGNLIKGSIEVKYREFSKPLDFYLAGIPMNYDSVGKQYNLESAGMCELVAFKEGEPVFVNPKSKPEINLVANNKSPEFNLYFLDTLQQKWVVKGKSTITETAKHTVKTSVSKTEKIFANLVEPIKPGKANNKTPVIKIVIDPSSFKELQAYNNLEFQIEATEDNFNAEDSKTDWSNVELLSTDSKGIYSVKFSNGNKTVSYKARPVFEGKDYDEALKVFEQKEAEYKSKLNDRLKQLQLNREQYVRDSIQERQLQEENESIARLNKLVDAKNKETEEENKKIAEENKVIERKNGELREKKKEYEKRIKEQEEKVKQVNEYNKQQEALYRNWNNYVKLITTFQIEGFGIWNCDRGIFLNFITLSVIFKDPEGKQLPLDRVSVITKKYNTLYSYYGSRLEVISDADCFLFSVYKDRLYYLSYDEYRKYKINGSSKKELFTMKSVPESDNNYEYLKELIHQ